MKNRVLPLAICSLLVFFTADQARAQDSALDQLKSWGGTAGSVPDAGSPTCAGCGGKGGHHRAGCPYADRSGARRRAAPWRTTAPARGLSSSEQMAVGIFESLFSGLMQEVMAPPPQFDTSYQQQLRKQQQEAEAARIKQKELERQHQLQQWREFQGKEAAERAMERTEKEKRSRELLAKMQTLGSDEPLRMESMSGGKLEPFMWGRPEIVDLSDKKVDEIEESQFFYDLQMRKTGGKIASLPSGEDQYYPILNELTEIQNKAPVTRVIGSKFMEELIGTAEEKTKKIPGAKGLIEAYQAVNEAGSIIRPLVMNILEHDMELISQAARGDGSSLIQETSYGEKTEEELKTNVRKFTIGVVENKIQ